MAERVLVTGAAGRIGTYLRPGLRGLIGYFAFVTLAYPAHPERGTFASWPDLSGYSVSDWPLLSLPQAF